VPSVTTPETAPAGWYGDPAGARVLRWWNGTEWTDDIAARGYEPLPSELLEKERRWATHAHHALIGLVVTHIVTALLYVWLVRLFVDAFESDGSSSLDYNFGGLWLQPGGFLAMGLQVVVAIWLYNAAGFCRSAGVPGRRDPGLALASFFIPIVISIAMAVVGQAMIADVVTAHEDLIVERRLASSVS
jgi:hypothetical protein